MVAVSKKTVAAGLATSCLVALVGGVILSHVLFPKMDSAVSTKKAEPVPTGFSAPVASVGCWDVSVQNDTELTATWQASCPDLPPATLGARPWPTSVIRLPALSGGEPNMATAQTNAVLSDELALRGSGALLFLPASKDGSGYYVAAWSDTEGTENAPVVNRGIQVGLYDVPPTSVATPVSRVYLTTALVPTGARERLANTPHARHRSQSAAAEDDSSDDAESSDSADE